MAQIDADQAEAAYQLDAAERTVVNTQMQSGSQHFSNGERTEAIAAWTRALHLDPQNLTIRKQIWMAAYPERFHPTIDFDWQQGQLAREQEAELALGICGPDGCPLPRRA